MSRNVKLSLGLVAIFIGTGVVTWCLYVCICKKRSEEEEEEDEPDKKIQHLTKSQVHPASQSINLTSESSEAVREKKAKEEAAKPKRYFRSGTKKKRKVKIDAIKQNREISETEQHIQLSVSNISQLNDQSYMTASEAPMTPTPDLENIKIPEQPPAKMRVSIETPANSAFASVETML